MTTLPFHDLRSWRRTLAQTVFCLITLALVACGEGGSPPEEGDSPPAGEPADAVSRDSVALVFSRNEDARTVWRRVPADSVGLKTALEQLLQGPTAEERDDGVDSWFSEATAGALRSVTVDSAGRAVVDFRNLPSLIPSASSSAGSEMLLQQLNGTVFRFPEIESVEYRVEGSCERFWEWLQYECRVVERGEETR